jgi:hypothetical protein
MPYPIGRFTVCDACQAAGGPNSGAAACDTYAGLNTCSNGCKK